jgi:hypothetical protein
MRHPAKKFALGTLAVNVIWLLFEHLMGYNNTKHDMGQYTRMFPVIFFTLMLAAAIYYQRKRQNNVISFPKGFRTGVVMTLIYCAAYTIVLILYQQFLNPEYFQTLKAFKVEHPQSQSETVKELVQMMSSGSPFSYFVIFCLSAIWGILFSAIAAFLLKKKPKGA